MPDRSSRRRWLSRFDWRVAVALAVTYVSFGSGAAGTKAAIASLPPLALVGVRGVIAGAILIGWSRLADAQWPEWRQWRAALIVGVLMLSMGAGSGALGQRTVPSGIAGVLSAMLPIFAACLGFLLFKERPPRRALVGLVLGVAGLGLLLRPGSDFDLIGVGLVVAGQFTWALGAELAPRIGLPDDPRLAAGAELFCGGAVLIGVSAALGDFGRLDLHAVSATAWGGFGWLVMTAIAGFTAYGFLARTVTPSVATTFSYVNPVVAMLLGWLLFSEPITAAMMAATAVVVVGVGLIVSTKSESPRVRHPLTSGHGHRRAIRVLADAPRPGEEAVTRRAA